jgi:formate hydrogenlyase subunit 3/multisubunit Na+/H+ antiporter MnhD subunit
LRGWAVRSPLLGASLAVVAVAAVGLPGTAVFVSRRDVIDGAVGGPLGLIVLAGSLGSVAIYGRLLWVGLRTPGASVAGTADWRPVGPAGWRSRSGGRAGQAAAGWDANKLPIAAVAVLLLAVISMAVSAGVVSAGR